MQRPFLDAVNCGFITASWPKLWPNVWCPLDLYSGIHVMQFLGRTARFAMHGCTLLSHFPTGMGLGYDPFSLIRTHSSACDQRTAFKSTREDVWKKMSETFEILMGTSLLRTNPHLISDLQCLNICLSWGLLWEVDGEHVLKRMWGKRKQIVDNIYCCM